jgi:mono/diheme cytochrome c family protein
MSALSLILLAGLAASPATSATAIPSAEQIERGRYLSVIGGCNDCHTPGYAPSGGKVPEAQWMTGDALGFAGPWGTTYPSNLRLRLGGMRVDEFKAYARALKTRPPMPYWALNTMSDADLEALWSFVHSLGPAGTPAPAALPPGSEAAGPVVRFPIPPAR